MMEKMTRRTFMKCAGAATLAVAFAGALTACGQETPPAAPTQPTPTQPTKPEANNTGIEVSDISTNTGYMNKQDGSKVLYAFVKFTGKNTSNAPITLNRDTFTIKLDDGAEQKVNSIFDRDGTHMTSFGSKELKAGESAALGLNIVISQSVYDNWNKDNHKIEMIAHNNGATASFKFQTKD